MFLYLYRFTNLKRAIMGDFDSSKFTKFYRVCLISPDGSSGTFVVPAFDFQLVVDPLLAIGCRVQVFDSFIKSFEKLDEMYRFENWYETKNYD